MKMDEFMSNVPKSNQDEEQRKMSKKRSDLISKKLGELLLQGFRMLNSTCDRCDCILMQKKNEPFYCVGCQDDDVRSLIYENNVTIEPIKEKSEKNIPEHVVSNLIEKENNKKTSFENLSTDVIRSKISWAIEQLKNSQALSYDLTLLDYIKKCSETITALNNING